MDARRIADRAILALARFWCFFTFPRVWLRTFRRSRAWPNPAAPVSDVDKSLWRKIFDHNPLFVTACDKLAAKRYAQSVCPELRTAEVLWIGSDTDLIPVDVLAGNVVVKANHGSRWNIMIQDGKVDRDAMRERTQSWLKRHYGRAFGEWAYKDASRCLFVEEMLLEDGQPITSEYKFHVAGGRTAYVYATRRNKEGKEEKCCFEPDGSVCPRPDNDDDAWAVMTPPPVFDRMRGIAERLAAPFDYMRCDLYELDGEIFFSELTTYPLSGQGGTNPHARALHNSRWDLRKSWFLTTPQTGWRKAYAAALRRWLDRTAA
jgi:hypothetical protein